MSHGSAAYFEEHKRNGRRVSALSLVVALTLLSPLLAMRITPFGDRVRNLPILRFGFAGPPRYVELMQIEANPTNLSRSRDVGHIVSGKSGDRGKSPRKASHAGQVKLKPVPGAIGESGSDLVARALEAQGSVPVMQSSDLVIDQLVRPEYPESSRQHGNEGHVAVLARVDTLGNVAEAEVMSPSGDPAMDLASRDAVMRCRFRPYRQNGQVTEVYAIFRFAFRIY